MAASLRVWGTVVVVPEGLGATYLGNGRTRFVVWAPAARQVEVVVRAPQGVVAPLERQDRGYHQATVDGVESGALYYYRLDGDKQRPDPASRHQPQGVHGPSCVVDPAFSWEDQGWRGPPLERYVLYELHVGTFTPEGTFQAVIRYLDYLRELGVTAVEIMPVAQFPGSRNWGYDGVYPFAVQDSYGGPQGLKRLVNACHQVGLAVVLDVVYNHLGPEGNYLPDFGPYFTQRYHTPWGLALNFDGPHSDEVRRYFIENALYWVTEFHVDALRLDAVHAIFDRSPYPFLEELGDAVHRRAAELGRPIYIMAESDLGDVRVVQPRELGGYGLDAQWCDDFHHALHALLTGEREGYYQDFGGLEHVAKAFTHGYVYTGQYSAFRQRRHGSPSQHIPAQRFVVFAQNHDQVGNRMLGERLGHLVGLEGLKLAAAAVILSPYIPLLFMGEEYGETAPFLYFVSHSDPRLVEAVRQGRQQEFQAFAWLGEPPDPQAEATFQRCKLDHTLRQGGHHRVLLDWYRELLRLRREVPALSTPGKEDLEAMAYNRYNKILGIRRWSGTSLVLLLFNFGDAPSQVTISLPEGSWHRRLSSSDERWQGRGHAIPEHMVSKGEVVLSLAPKTFALYEKGSGA